MEKVWPTHDYLLNIYVCGGKSSGKTSFIAQHCDHIFVENNTHQGKKYLSTSRVCEAPPFKTCTLVVNNKTSILKIWKHYDRGQGANLSMYRGSHAIFFLFDVCDLESFKNIKLYIGEADRCRREEAHFVLIGCKADKVDERVVTQLIATEFSQAINIPYFEVNSKDPSPIERQTFDSIFQTTVNSIMLSFFNDNKTTITTTTPIETKTKSKKSLIKFWK